MGEIPRRTGQLGEAAAALRALGGGEGVGLGDGGGYLLGGGVDVLLVDLHLRGVLVLDALCGLRGQGRERGQGEA